MSSSRIDCPRCKGEGERTTNHSWPFDPQAENSELCRNCQGTGYLDLHNFDADQDEWAERSAYSDWPRAHRSFPQADPGHHIAATSPAAPSSSLTRRVRSGHAGLGDGTDLPSAA